MTKKEQKIKIILVDDNPADSRLFEECLKQVGFSFDFEAYNNGQDFIDILQNKSPFNLPDIVFLDLNLAGLNGKEILKIIKTDDRLKTIPILILTTSSSYEDRKDCYQSHANAYLVKPIDFNDFVSLIQSFKSFWLNPYIRLATHD